MKVLHIFNRANVPYFLVKALRRKGIDADLIYSQIEAQRAKASDPFNEPSCKNEPWLIKWNGDSLHPFRNKKEFLKLIKIARKYDLIHCHYPSSIFIQFIRKPFVVHETGWIRVAPYRNLFTDRLMKYSFRKAKYVVMTNPDCYDILDNMKYKKECFLPFCVDTESYKPVTTKPVDDLFFHPNRQHWEYKGTDKLINGFAEYVKENKEAKLVLIKFGADLEKTLSLIKKLNLEKNIVWYDFLNKDELIKLYQSSTGIVDQFNVGSYGTVGVEAMACGKPLVININEKYFKRAFGNDVSLPFLNCKNSKEISQALNILKDETKNKKYSKLSREFAIKYHSFDSVADKCIDLYNKILLK